MIIIIIIIIVILKVTYANKIKQDLSSPEID